MLSCLLVKARCLVCLRKDFERVFRYVFPEKCFTLFPTSVSARVHNNERLPHRISSASAFRSEKSGVIRSRSSAFASSSSPSSLGEKAAKFRSASLVVVVPVSSSRGFRFRPGRFLLRRERSERRRRTTRTCAAARIRHFERAGKRRARVPSARLVQPGETEATRKDMQKKARRGRVQGGVDQFLLYDFFVILFILAWLVFGGVGVRLGVY